MESSSIKPEHVRVREEHDEKEQEAGDGKLGTPSLKGYYVYDLRVRT